MKIKQHLPSIFTLINLFLGFLAIINTMAGDYVVACYIIRRQAHSILLMEKLPD